MNAVVEIAFSSELAKIKAGTFEKTAAKGRVSSGLSHVEKAIRRMVGQDHTKHDPEEKIEGVYAEKKAAEIPGFSEEVDAIATWVEKQAKLSPEKEAKLRKAVSEGESAGRKARGAVGGAVVGGATGAALGGLSAAALRKLLKMPVDVKGSAVLSGGVSALTGAARGASSSGKEKKAGGEKLVWSPELQQNVPPEVAKEAKKSKANKKMVHILSQKGPEKTAGLGKTELKVVKGKGGKKLIRVGDGMSAHYREYSPENMAKLQKVYGTKTAAARPYIPKADGKIRQFLSELGGKRRGEAQAVLERAKQKAPSVTSSNPGVKQQQAEARKKHLDPYEALLREEQAATSKARKKTVGGLSAAGLTTAAGMHAMKDGKEKDAFVGGALRKAFGAVTKNRGRQLAAGLTTAGIGGAGIYGASQTDTGKRLRSRARAYMPGTTMIPAKIKNSRIFKTIVERAQRKFPDVPQSKIEELVYQAMKEKGVLDKVSHVTAGELEKHAMAKIALSGKAIAGLAGASALAGAAGGGKAVDAIHKGKEKRRQEKIKAYQMGMQRGRQSAMSEAQRQRLIAMVRKQQELKSKGHSLGDGHGHKPSGQ